MQKSCVRILVYQSTQDANAKFFINNYWKETGKICFFFIPKFITYDKISCFLNFSSFGNYTKY